MAAAEGGDMGVEVVRPQLGHIAGIRSVHRPLRSRYVRLVVRHHRDRSLNAAAERTFFEPNSPARAKLPLNSKCFRCCLCL